MFTTENLENVSKPKDNKKLPKFKKVKKRKMEIEQSVAVDTDSYHLMAKCINLR